MLSRIRQISSLGQAIWLDYISRELLWSGKLRELIAEGVTGVTSNPSIFQKSISTGGEYDRQIRESVRAGRNAYETYEALALQDIAEAADQLRPVYNETHARDGFVSIEVNPALADDAAATIAEARRLHQSLGRPNVMIKVPATEAGLPAISTLIGEGINVNVTLIFSVPMYERVMQAYLDGLRGLRATHRPLGLVSSVASFFVSRVDTLIDKLLDQRIEQGEDELEELRGKAAVANAQIAYQKFKAVFEGSAFDEFRSAGARPQRPLWASTSTKNPAYSDTMYVDPLIGVHTVNTVPPQTLDAIRARAVAAQTISRDVDLAHGVMARLAEIGINIDDVTTRLLDEGVKIFRDSFEKLLADVESKRAAMERAA